MYLAFKWHATIAPQPAPTITSAIQLQNLAGTSLQNPEQTLKPYPQPEQKLNFMTNFNNSNNFNKS